MMIDAGILLAIAIPLISWGVWLSWTVQRASVKVVILENMHNNADQYGFGTGKTNTLIATNTRAMNDLTHYIRWSIKESTGKEPPPPLPGGIA